MTEQEDEETYECRCVPVDVDQGDARDCPVHGPGGIMDRDLRKRHVEEEMAFWGSVGEF